MKSINQSACNHLQPERFSEKSTTFIYKKQPEFCKLQELPPSIFALMSNKSIQIKTLLLLAVFGLNTVASFACSAGLVCFSNHHQGFNIATTRSHRAKQTPSQPAYSPSHCYHGHGDEDKSHDHGAGYAPCCSPSVRKLYEPAKPLTEANQKILPIPVELLTAIHNCKLGGNPALMEALTWKPPFVRSGTIHTIPNLRIIIQSLQI